MIVFKVVEYSLNSFKGFRFIWANDKINISYYIEKVIQKSRNSYFEFY